MSDHASAPDGGTPRRRFLGWLGTSLAALAATAVGIPVIGFLFSPPPRPGPPSARWRSVGTVDQFHVGETVEVRFRDADAVPWAGQAAATAAWLRRTGPADFVAFSINCTHLGCPVRWMPNAGLFLCPCHGGVYYDDGSVAAGPPPRALAQYPVRVAAGRVLVAASALPV